MQTFLPYPNITKSLECLDDKRLGKQRVEARQILFILLWEKEEDKSIANAERLANKLFIPKPMPETRLKNMLRWRNHPAVAMWRGAEDVLADYAQMTIAIWEKQGFSNNMPYYLLISGQKFPAWFGNYRFHLAHRSQLLKKDFEHYSKVFGATKPQSYVFAYIWPESAEDSLEK